MYRSHEDIDAEIWRNIYEKQLFQEIGTVFFLRSNDRKFTSLAITDLLKTIKEVKVSQGIACNSILYSQRVFSPNVIYLPFC